MVHVLADITGTGAAQVQLSTTSQKACWIQIQAHVSNSAAARIGDSLTSSTRGIIIAVGGAYQFLPTAGNTNQYDLNSIYYYLANGDKFTISYATN